MIIKRIKIIKECEDPTGRHKGKIQPGRIITGGAEKMDLYLKKGYAKEIGVKGTNFKSKEEAENYIERKLKKDK